MHRFNASPEATVGDCPADGSRRRFLEYAGAGAVAVALPACGGGGSNSVPTPTGGYARTMAWGRQTIAARLADQPQDIATISIALLKDDAIVWRQAFGNASASGPVAATVDTRYNIGSVSKVIAALAAVILQDRGLIDLDAPIVGYLPSFSMLSPEYRQITTRHLLSHSSGLPGTNGRDIFTYAPVAGYAAATQAALAGQHLKHRPGEMAVYCNDGFTMVEPVVEAVTGQSYDRFVRENILEPLGMSRSGFLTTTEERDVFALPWQGGANRPREYCNAYGSGGLSTTPTDMMNLARMFLGGGVFEGRRIVSAAGIADMATDQTRGTRIKAPTSWQWGLGWDTVVQTALEVAGVTAWEKSGGTAFFQTEFFVLPQARMALLVTGSAGYQPLALAEEVLMRALAEDGTIAQAPAFVSLALPPAAPAPDVSAALGIYGNHLQPLRALGLADGTLALDQWDGSAWTPLHAGAISWRYGADGWWWSADHPRHSYGFAEAMGTDGAGQPFRFRYLIERDARFGAGYVRTLMPLAQQLEPRAPLDAAWQAHLQTPTWRITNLSAQDIQYVESDGDVTFTLGQVAELPGYVLLENQPLVPLAGDRGGMTLKIPVNLGRDLYEIVLSDAGGKWTMTAGAFELEPA